MTPTHTVRLIARREIREGLRNRTLMTSFAITTLLILLVVFLPTVFGDDTTTLGIVEGVEVDRDALTETADESDLDLELEDVADLAAAEAAVEDGDLDAALSGPAELVVEDQPSAELRAVVAEVTGRDAVLADLEALGLDPQEAAAALDAGDGVTVRSLDPTDDFAEFMVALAGTVLMLMGVTFFASQVLTGVVEEKSSRVVEVVLGAVRPTELLTGKLLGIGSLAILQVGGLLAIAFVAINVSGAIDLPASAGPTIAAVAVWFVLGFAFYAVVYAAAGSLVSRVEDAQSTAGPIGFLLFAAYGLSFVVVVPNPESLASRIVSLIPGVAPLTMPARVAFGAATATEQVAAIIISAVATVLAVRVAARIYERSLLRTGQVRWREALRQSG